MPAAVTGLVERLRAARVRVWIEGEVVAPLRTEVSCSLEEILAEVERLPDHDLEGSPES
jgi:hypothetical protein